MITADDKERSQPHSLATDAVGSGLQIRAVHPTYGLRLLEQHARRPERVIEIAPLRLQLGGESAVEHDSVLVSQAGSER